MNVLSYLSNALSIFGPVTTPKDVIFFITSRCNAKCNFCHFKEQIKDPNRENELTIEEIRKIAQNFNKIAKLSLCGGEPFLRSDIEEIVTTFAIECNTKIFDVPTNGSQPKVISDKVAMMLPLLPEDVLLEIQLSVDGPAEIHDILRGIPGLFNKILETYDRLNNIRNTDPRLKIKMNMVYLPENEDNIIDLARFFQKRAKFDRFQVTFPHGENITDEIISHISYNKFYTISKRILHETPFCNRKDLHSLLFRAIKMLRDEVLYDVVPHGNGRVPLRRKGRRTNMGAFCHAGKRIIVIDEIGTVFPCEPLWESVGNLRSTNYDIKKVLSSPHMNMFRQKYLGRDKCNCTWGCAALEKILFSPLYYPRIIYNMIFLFIRGGQGIGA